MNRYFPESPLVPTDVSRAAFSDYERWSNEPLPVSWEEFLRDNYHIDVASEYAGQPIKNPWGKASGQLSMTDRQVADDVVAGLGFVVLKTVIAQDDSGQQSMSAWAIRESRMVVEPITGQSGETGWTVSWKGRGWWHTFDDYLKFVRDSQQIASGRGTLIVPSCKYHLPTVDEADWNLDEYRYTTSCLLDAYTTGESDSPINPMPLEKDFSPTLAGSDKAAVQQQILNWLQSVPANIRDSVDDGRNKIRVGLKLFNALFDDEFQLEMLRTIHNNDVTPDFFIYGNRLFDPNREFDGKQGIAYGGPDLSDRNLRIMRQFQAERIAAGQPMLPWSATGNITTGKMALEYALCGASSFQLHTFFQLPNSEYKKTAGNKTEKALHELYLHPETGLVVWLHHLAGQLDLDSDEIRLRDIIGQGPALKG